MGKKIVLFGKSGSGKDYLTSRLCLHEGFQRFAFADNVKRHIALLLGITDENFSRYLHDEDFKNHTLVNVSRMCIEEIADVQHRNEHWENALCAEMFSNMNDNMTYEQVSASRIYMSLREFTVWYGTNLMQKYCGKKVWCHSLFNSEAYKQVQSDDKPIIITDCRFPHEYQECRARGFKIVQVVDPNNQLEEVKNLAESFYDSFRPDFVFVNDKTSKTLFENEYKRLKEWLEC